jgi:hypothetical protein
MHATKNGAKTPYFLEGFMGETFLTPVSGVSRTDHFV